MAKSKTTKASKENSQEKHGTRAGVMDNVWGVVFVALGIFLFLAIQFEIAGAFGNLLGEWLKGILGLVGLILPWYLILFGLLLFTNKTVHVKPWIILLAFVMLLMLCLLNAGRFIDSAHIFWDAKAFYQDGVALEGGGVLGMSLAMVIVRFFGKAGLYLIAIVGIVVCVLLLINTPVSQGIEKVQEKKALRDQEKALRRQEAALQREETDRSQIAALVNEAPAANGKEVASGQTAIPGDSAEPSAPAPKERRGILDSLRRTHAEPENTKKEKVFELLQDDHLLEKTPDKELASAPAPAPIPVLSYGLEAPGERKPGFGLDGTVEGANPGGLGLDGTGGGAHAPATDAAMPAAEAPSAEPKRTRSRKSSQPVETLSESDFAKPVTGGKYQKPPIDLLSQPRVEGDQNNSAQLRQKAQLLEDTLRNFNVEAKVVQVTQGPAVTRYEIQPAVGVKVSKIVGLSDDIALNLRAKSIRIEAPIPGKAAVGIEVENEKIRMVTIREIIDSREFKTAKSRITFAVGKDIAGKSIVADLKSMPHLLIAGSTGSGKSVCINSIITSILYKADPEEVKMVLIDPKVVELGNYNGIPHLLVPVVTEPNKAAATLNWAVSEMTRRYKAFADTGCRDLEGYNDHMRSQGKADEVMPQVVIIIDELADLMMAAPSQVEESICRLAQMARAAGMHLIVATQRPSVDIITGVIKANIPSRIAFAVSSRFDSSTILDMGGAEKLVGKGDMLFNPLGMGKPLRVQGTFISDDEVHRVIEHVKAQVEETTYSEDVMDTIERGDMAATAASDETDELLPEAIACVVAAGQASVSMIQRRFRVGYNRGARIMDMLEERGIVGPQDGSRPRQVLLSQEEWEAMQQPAAGEGEEHL